MSWWKIEMHDSVNDIELFRFDGATWPDDHVRAFKALHGVGPFTVTRVVPDKLPPLKGIGMLADVERDRERASHPHPGGAKHCIGGYINGRPCPHSKRLAA
jgi:hypothetical protein